jgi:hypothetical protein
LVIDEEGHPLSGRFKGNMPMPPSCCDISSDSSSEDGSSDEYYWHHSNEGPPPIPQAEKEVHEWYIQHPDHEMTGRSNRTRKHLKAKRQMRRGGQIIRKQFNLKHYVQEPIEDQCEDWSRREYNMLTFPQILSCEQYRDLIDTPFHERTREDKVENLLCIVNRECKELQFLDLVRKQQPFLYNQVTGLSGAFRADMFKLLTPRIAAEIDRELFTEEDLVPLILSEMQYKDYSCLGAKDSPYIPMNNENCLLHLCRVVCDNGDSSIQQLGHLIWRVNPHLYNKLNLLLICSEPAQEAAHAGNVEFLRCQLLPSDDQRLKELAPTIGRYIPPWELDYKQLVPHCLSVDVHRRIKEAFPYHASNQMEAVAKECIRANTSRRFMELLHLRVTHKTNPHFSITLKLMLASNRQPQNIYPPPPRPPPLPRSCLFGTNSNDTGFDGGSLFGNKPSPRQTLVKTLFGNKTTPQEISLESRKKELEKRGFTFGASQEISLGRPPTARQTIESYKKELEKEGSGPVKYPHPVKDSLGGIVMKHRPFPFEEEQAVEEFEAAKKATLNFGEPKPKMSKVELPPKYNA